MLNSKQLYNFLLIPFVLLLQVMVFNNLVVFNGLFPMIYIIFILFYEAKENNTFFLLLAFLLGIGLDMANYTLGLNAFACVLIAYLRPYVIQLVDRNSFFEISNFSFSNFNLLQVFVYILLMSFIHHFAIYSLEAMKISLLINSIVKSLFNAVLSSLFIFIYTFLKNKH